MPILGIGNYKFEPYHLVFLFLMDKQLKLQSKPPLKWAMLQNKSPFKWTKVLNKSPFKWKFNNNKKYKLADNVLISNKKYFLGLGHNVDITTADLVTNQIINGFLLKSKTYQSGPHRKNVEWFSRLSTNQGCFTSAINLQVNAAIKFINEVKLPSLCMRYEKWKDRNRKIFAKIKDKSAWQILDSRVYCNSTEKHGDVVISNQWNERFIIIDTNVCGKKSNLVCLFETRALFNRFETQLILNNLSNCYDVSPLLLKKFKPLFLNFNRRSNIICKSINKAKIAQKFTKNWLIIDLENFKPLVNLVDKPYY